MSVIINRIHYLRRGHHTRNYEGRSQPCGQPIRHHIQCDQCRKRSVRSSRDHST